MLAVDLIYMMRGLLILISLSLVLQGPYALSKPLCSQALSGTNLGFSSLLKELNSEPYKPLWTDQALDSRTPNFGWWRKLKLKSLQNRVEHLKTSKNFENTTYDLWLLTQGPKLESLNWLRLSQDRSYEKRIHAWTQRQLILQGLKGISADAAPSKSFQNFQAQLSYVFQVKLKGLAILPFSFPRKADAQIPKELLQKILLNGIEAHKTELQKLYGRQRLTDYYHALRPYLNLLGFIALGLVLDEVAEKIEDHRARENAKNLLHDMQELNSALDDLLLDIKSRKNNGVL